MIGYIYSRKLDYLTILNNIHEAMKLKFHMDSEKANAERIEKILREIKRYSMSLKDDTWVDAELNAQYEELVAEATKFLGKYRGSRGMSERALFQRTHSKFARRKYSDDIFEEELASIFAAVEKMGTEEKNIKADIHLMGTREVTSDALQYVLGTNKSGDLISDYVLKTNNEIAKTYKSKYERDELTVKVGKIDVSGVSLEITKPLPSQVEELARLTAGKNFSLKNYSSFKDIEGTVRDDEGNIIKKGTGDVIYKTLSEIKINFGDSDVFKGVTGGLSELDQNLKNQLSFYYRGLNHLKWNKKNYAISVEEHWSHLKSIYEIKGSGTFDIETGKSGEVDYIVWNDPSSENIYVRDVGSLVYKAIFESSTKRGLFSKVNIRGNNI